MSDVKDAVRAVVEAARTWAKGRPQGTDGGPLEALYDATEELEALIARPEMFEYRLAWKHVRPGDQVMAPNGMWFEVVKSWEGSTPKRQMVSIIVKGIEGPVTPRVADEVVNVRRRSNPLNDAIDALADAFGDVRAISEDWS